MTGVVTKAGAFRSDLDNYDGTLQGSRANSAGGTTTGLKVGDWVDILQVYGSGDPNNMNHATLSKAVGALGAQNVGLLFAPGTWVIDTTISLASNFTVILPPGAILAPDAGITITINGWLFRMHDTYTSGSGTVTISGNDLLQVLDATTEYAVDTGSADAYAIAPTPAISSYAAGQFFRFRATNTNTGASTFDVNGVGAKSIVQADGSTALAAGHITANQIVIVQYDSVGDEFHLVPTQQPPANPAKTDAANVYTKTETWKHGTDVSSASDLDVTGDGNVFDVTGTTTISSIQSKGVGTIIVLEFDAALTIEYDSADLVLPNSEDIVTAAGDIAIFEEYASADWRLISFLRAGRSTTGSTIPTAVDVSSGSPTDATFTSIPPWASEITMALDGVSLSGTDNILIRLGTSGGVASSGYTTQRSNEVGCQTNSITESTDAWEIQTGGAASLVYGQITFRRQIAGGTVWSGHGSFETGTGRRNSTTGTCTLGGALDRVQVTRDGTDTFDAGTVYLSYT